MRAVAVVLRREVQAYFVSPIAYITIAGFLVIAGFGFSTALKTYARIPPASFMLREITIQSNLVPRIGVWVTAAMLMCLPALSMRLFSEERKGGTIELLLTSPLTTSQLVVAKYLGALVIHATMLALTFPYLVLLGRVGHPEWGPMATTYVGFLLFGSVLLAIGQFASAVTENQIIAIVITYAVFMPLMLVDLLLNFVGTQTADILAGVSVMVARRGLTHGVIDTHALVLHACLIFLFLFLSGQVLESNRWR